MKKTVYLFFIGMISSFVLSGQGRNAPVDYVDPFIGTSNYGATFPGAVVPWGMASVVPFNVTPAKGNDYSNTNGWCSNPYVNNNKVMSGFSHVNLSGVGCPDLGSIILMPTTGKLEVDFEKYGSAYSDEEATPGYYSMKIDKYGIKAEMSATKRSGISRYTFPEGESHILVNIGLGLTNESGGEIKMVSDTELEGFKLLGTFCYNPQAVFPVFYVVRFSKPAINKGYWKFHDKLPGARDKFSSTSGKYKIYTRYEKEMAGDKIGAFYSFNTKEGEVIEVRVGISYVSIENARLNLEEEQTGKTFEDIVADAHKAWNTELSKIEVEGGTRDDKVMFYTALYHVLFHPNILQDVNGMYPAMESPDILKTESNRYTVFSLWDTYRTIHPFLTLVYPDRQIDMVKSMIEMYNESGWLPKWELYSRETHVMEGDPSLIVLADTYLRGLKDFDVDLAYEAMKKNADTPGEENFIRPDNDFFMEHHYVPFTKKYDNSVSQALEYYMAEYSLAMLAKALGHEEDYKIHYQRALGYKIYFDKSYDLLRPVLPDGKFMEGFDPVQGMNFEPVHGFHEGNSWQYSFAVPFDIKGLVKLMGGCKRFVSMLNKCFNDSLFDMSNEPDMGYPYFFNYCKGDEWQTQRQVNDCIRRYYNTSPAGLPGNDDTGTLSAWLLYSMMGFYPVCPASRDYALTSPVFDKVIIHLDKRYYDHNTIVIEANHDSPKDIYIQGIELGGKKLKSYFISQEQLTSGQKLSFDLTDEPDK